MALNSAVEKVRDKGAIKIYGEHSVSAGELVFLALAVFIMAKKGGVNVKNFWVMVALVLILLAFCVW